jgi:magnesium chelatase family protein
VWAICGSFVFVTAMNPGPCGYNSDDQKQCSCFMSAVQRYQQRISGPLMDCIDIHQDMVRLPFQKLASSEEGEPARAIRQRVEAVRKIQEAPFRKVALSMQGFPQRRRLRSHFPDSALLMSAVVRGFFVPFLSRAFTPL